MLNKNSLLAILPEPPKGKTGWPWTEETEPLPDYMPDGNPWPKVSVVTPCYNHADFIEETMRSVLLQGYPNLEYIVIDGGSSDGSNDIIKKYARFLTFWVSEPDKGQSNAINKGFKQATGELVGWINSDDIYFPGAINYVVAYWVSNHRPYALITGTKLKGDSSLSEITKLEQYPLTIKHLIEKNIIEQPSTFYPRKLLQKVGYIDERYRMSMDYDLWLRMAREGVDLIFLDKDLAVTRVHPLAKTTRFQRRSLTEVLQTVWRNYHVIPELWLKKFLTVWIIPNEIKSELSKKLLYRIRNIILKTSNFVLRKLQLNEYQEE